MSKINIILIYINLFAMFLSATAGQVNWVSLIVIIYLILMEELREHK